MNGCFYFVRFSLLRNSQEIGSEGQYSISKMTYYVSLGTLNRNQLISFNQDFVYRATKSIDVLLCESCHIPKMGEHIVH